MGEIAQNIGGALPTWWPLRIVSHRNLQSPTLVNSTATGNRLPNGAQECIIRSAQPALDC
ncbi:hypothetical protein ACIPSA_42600 [Streptomyces sp. NPDC086549]|uniref:hypothetical protein n=1 Tax=Streptomyces sp. NPDC086549 TaxID=3365752 RepID=UPI00382A5CFC